jgi:hypothetical protein
MKRISKKLLFFGFLLLIFTSFLLIKTFQGFQVNCSTITDCETCGNTYGCTFCKTAKKCVNNNDFKTSCPNDTPINTAEDCVDCSSYTDCRSCTIVRDRENPNIEKTNDNCVWCKRSNKCVSDLSVNTLCPRESTTNNTRGCGSTTTESNRGIKYINGVAYGVRYDSSGNQTIDTIPYIFDKDTSVDAIRSQMDSGVYSSETQRTQGTTSTSAGRSMTDVDMNPINTFDYSNISLSYPGNSVIPILGLQRDLTGHLLKSSLETIVSSAQASGLITASGSKKPLLDAIQKENDFYIKQKKEYMKKFLSNSIDYIDDEDSLRKVREIDIKITDLNDISGYVKGLEGFQNKFKEGYQNLSKKEVFEYELIKNKGAAGYMQILWLANLLGIGAFLYFINNK